MSTSRANQGYTTLFSDPEIEEYCRTLLKNVGVETRPFVIYPGKGDSGKADAEISFTAGVPLNATAIKALTRGDDYFAKK